VFVVWCSAGGVVTHHTNMGESPVERDLSPLTFVLYLGGWLVFLVLTTIAVIVLGCAPGGA
jgi:hypothetical protein